MEKRVKTEWSRGDVMNEFMDVVIENGYMIFGGAVRDKIAGVEPVDVDIYIESTEPRDARKIAEFIETMNAYSFEELIVAENTDWTRYNKNLPARVFHYNVRNKEIVFKVDLVLSKYKPCFGNLDCIVNGLCLTKNGISFVDIELTGECFANFANMTINTVKKMIADREPGVLPGCDDYRIDKMSSKGYNMSKWMESVD